MWVWVVTLGHKLAEALANESSLPRSPAPLYVTATSGSPLAP